MPKVVTIQELKEREGRIIETACELIGHFGFAGVTMDKVVAEVPYSKGSVYKHFGSIEELLLAITNSGSYHLIELMEKAYDFEGNSREKCLARTFAYFLYSQLYPIHFFCEMEALTPSVREKASKERLIEGVELLGKFSATAQRFIRFGIESGDLCNSQMNQLNQATVSTWAAEFGICSYAMALHRSNSGLPERQREALEQQLFFHANAVLDGMNWLPLSAERDYEKVWRQFEKFYFRDEMDRLMGSV